jgi:hypothetical protein
MIAGVRIIVKDERRTGVGIIDGDKDVRNKKTL